MVGNKDNRVMPRNYRSDSCPLFLKPAYLHQISAGQLSADSSSTATFYCLNGVIFQRLQVIMSETALFLLLFSQYPITAQVSSIFSSLCIGVITRLNQDPRRLKQLCVATDTLHSFAYRVKLTLLPCSETICVPFSQWLQGYRGYRDIPVIPHYFGSWFSRVITSIHNELKMLISQTLSIALRIKKLRDWQEET